MRIVDALRDRSRLAQILDPNAHELVEGTPDDQLKARREWHRARAAHVIMSTKDEIPRNELDFSGRHWIEHTPTGAFYTVFGGDPQFSETVAHFFVREDGTPIMLEPADPPSRAELKKRQAAKQKQRAEREAAAKQRRAEIKAAAGR